MAINNPLLNVLNTNSTNPVDLLRDIKVPPQPKRFGDRFRNMTPEKKQGLSQMLYLLGGSLKGNDMSKDMAMLQQNQAIRKAEADQLGWNKTVDQMALERNPDGKLKYNASQIAILRTPAGRKAYTDFDIKRQFGTTETDNSFTNRKGLRGEFNTNAKSSKAVIGSASKIRKQLELGTGFSDVASVYAFFTALDPGGRVTDGELRISEGASGAARAFQNSYNKFLKGDQLDPASRQELLETVNAIAVPAVTEYNSLVDRYTVLAERNNMPVDQIVSGKLDAIDTTPLIQPTNMYDSLPENSTYIGMSKNNKPMFRTPTGEIIEQQ
jgi:hypothetical protein